jgi:hypothetical protein
VLARPRRLDRGVEREQVGLLGEVVDRLDDGADLLAQPAEVFDAGARPWLSRRPVRT